MAYNICYFIGGTGARIAEVAVHMVASGFFDKNEHIEFVVIDKDLSCKSYIDAISQLDKYNIAQNIINEGRVPGNDLFKNKITKYDWSFNFIFNELANVNSDTPLKDSVISRESKEKTTTDGFLLDAFYSKAEQNKSTGKGFYGHPSIGALIFKYMTKHQEFEKSEEFNIITPIKKGIADQSEQVRVVIAGTVFGGTGASVLSNLARYIRNSFKEKEEANQRIIISGVLILPYFKIPKPEKAIEDQDMMIDEKEFLPKSQVALEHYGISPNLIRRNVGNNIFDRLYAVGSHPYHKTSEKYAEGGEEQKSHFDFIDIVAASSIFHFLNADNYNNQRDTSNIMLFQKSNENHLSWKDMPSGYKADFLSLLKFSSFIITVLYPSFRYGEFDEVARSKNAMAKCLYGARGSTHQAQPDHMEEMASMVRDVFKYCETFIKLVHDLSYNGMNWKKYSIKPEKQDNVDLFATDYINDLFQLCKALNEPKPNIESLKNQCALMSKEVIIESEGKEIDNLAIQNELTDKFSKKKFSGGVKVATRVGHYLCEIYSLCK
jgi:hypothetical protein